MAMQRRIRGEGGSTSSPPITMLSESEVPKKKARYGAMTWAAVLLSLAVVLVYLWLALSQKKDFEFRIEERISLRLKFDRPDPNRRYEISLGPHAALLDIRKECFVPPRPPRLLMRLSGSALVPIQLIRKEASLWVADIFLPIEGSYNFEARWLGCGDSNDDASPREKNFQIDTLTAQGERAGPVKKHSSSPGNDIFPDGAWIAPNKFPQNSAAPISQPYVWTSLETPPNEGLSLLKAPNYLGDSVVIKEATPISTNFRYLSNYEIVCWLGGAYAYGIYESFLALRAELFPRQRPFKFHYRNMTSFTQPDKDWEDSEKERFRKCKILFVSVEELDLSLTQLEYMDQVKTFLGHLVQAFADETFPIWMLTLNQHPLAPSPMCGRPTISTTVQNHPCNIALFDLFQDSPFPERVKLLDTTDLAYAQLGENLKDVLAVIAMRTFAVVAHQVTMWRSKNQQGTKEGLMRDGKLEPNVHHQAYDWAAKAERL